LFGFTMDKMFSTGLFNQAAADQLDEAATAVFDDKAMKSKFPAAVYTRFKQSLVTGEVTSRRICRQLLMRYSVGHEAKEQLPLLIGSSLCAVGAELWVELAALSRWTPSLI